MLFNSYEFIYIFLPLTLVIFFTLANHNKHSALLILVISSLIFYGCLSLHYLPLLIVSVMVNYFVSVRISASGFSWNWPGKKYTSSKSSGGSGNFSSDEKLSTNTSAKKFWLILGIVFNFALLGYFKVINSLPLGISFYTFTQTAHLVEVFRNSITTKSLLEYSGYVTFFPCITSGPIMNAKTFSLSYELDYENIARGITRFTLGLFKKVCIADLLAHTVNELFASAGFLTFIEAWAAAFGYGMQLYFDFSGYSDMAIGIGLMFGVSLPENFNSPYKSTSIIDFWRRWHISLGAWIRDYIYIPLGGSREGEFKKIRNVFIAMLFTGIWHGTGLTFIIWGLLHGVFLAVNHQWRRLNVKLPALISWLITFLCVTFAWVIFRAENLNEAGKIITAMLNVKNIMLPSRLAGYLGFLGAYGVSFGVFATGLKMLALIPFAMIITFFFSNSKELTGNFKPGIVKLAIVFVLLVISFVNLSGISDFLYFQF
ncbi:MAG: MBOAT family protein [Synergistaceae bacterium]|nr:MBOAT family protein [Synergistaceae bacterium]